MRRGAETIVGHRRRIETNRRRRVFFVIRTSCFVACAVILIGAPCVAAEDEHPASKAVAGLDVAPGLEVTLFAAEPMLLSPTNIDVDHRGRVWVCEVVNYRHRNGSRPAGDRILILEDTDGDGKADQTKVFYQGRDVDTAMGICVLGNRVIVSVSPNVIVLTDTDGDDKADKKEFLFTKTGREQHDHTAHKFLFGPDGRLYWNFGNEGHSVHDRDGKPVIDIFGRLVADDGKPYRGGMAFRCDQDGKNFEVLAHNFRNNYELAVDSFGGIWQSDNDDDGNRGVRLNFLLEYGNYGYRDEMTGASWQTPRTNLEEDIPSRHWHQNDPGVVPNLLTTGNGSPTGIVVYEGSLLPEIYRNQIIHCDAGPRVVRAYPVVNDGAGYKARAVDILRGTRDTWFRPSDVCVAPDGSLFVADWYDPGVGGHHMGDIDRGRIFRVAPPKTPYRVPKYNFSTVDGAVAALQSPNLAARYLAYTALQSRISEAAPALTRLFKESENPRMRARVLWLLATIQYRSGECFAAAVNDSDADVRMMAPRMARSFPDIREKFPGLIWAVIDDLWTDPSPQVRRECAIAIRNLKNGPQKAKRWALLAVQHDGRDRWYLEALGIGAEGDWDACLPAWLKIAGGKWNTPAGRDIIWRSRSKQTPEYLAKILEDPSTPVKTLPRYLRAFDFLSGPEKERALARLAFGESQQNPESKKLIVAEAIQRLDRQEVLKNPAHVAALKQVVASMRGTPRFVELIDRYDLHGYGDELLAWAQIHPADALGVRAVRILFSQNESPRIATVLKSGKENLVEDTVRVLGSAEDPRGSPLLMSVVDDQNRPIELRRQAVQAIARTRTGAAELLDRAQAGQLDPQLREAASASLHASASAGIRERADKLFPLPPAADARPLPPIRELVRRRGNAHKGKIVFATVGTCAKCHVAGSDGKDVGPNLSEIGAKLSRPALYESILFPSAGISHNFATYTLVLESGNIVSGILTSRTSNTVSIRGIDAITRSYSISEIEEIKEQTVSLMPADLQKSMTADDLVDVVEYLTTLKPGPNGKLQDSGTKVGDNKKAAGTP